NGHPEIDQHTGADKQFLIYEKTFYNQNNLPKDIQSQIDLLISIKDWLSSNDERQANELVLIRRQVKVVPEYQPLVHRPPAYPQRARVVGPEGESIHVDQLGHITAPFLFTRVGDPRPHRGALR
ncbi:type VI secretion system tip protein VgrG, partial [Acinetobacter variabilis]